jgi:LmbE family N-acetylglucosaminyl deacetylase
MSQDDPRTLLAVLAHPDDETFGIGGTLALYARRGVQAYLICATRGEAGTVSPEFMQGHPSIAALREHELRCAAQHLGLAGVHFLDYRDSGMPGSPDNQHPQALINAPRSEVVHKITRLIRQLRPQVVITFDPVGGYGHPDHVTTHQATVEAFQAAGDPSRFPEDLPAHQPDKLYFTVFSRAYLRVALRLMRLAGRGPRRWGRNQDIDLEELAQHRFPIHARVNYRSVAELKKKATACHASQLDMGRSNPGLLGLAFRLARLGATETFMRAYPAPNSDRPERDLFLGIDLRPNSPPTA